MRIIMLCIVTMGIATADKVSYEGYKLFSMIPKTFTQLMLLKKFKEMGDAEYSFWQEPNLIDGEVFLMVPPRNLDQFYKMIEGFKVPITDEDEYGLWDDFNLNFEVRIDNIQKLIDDTTTPQNKSQGFDFKQYHTLEEIYDNLEELAKKYPNKVQVVVGGRTYEGREIKGVKIISGDEKPGIFIEGGIHAREWISPATVMYILHQLLTCSEDSDVRYLADTYNWFIFPVFNPDGYVFSHVKDRLWKKNRKPSSDICIGSDLNRNWDFCWNTTGTSNNPCDPDYPGSEPFSEIETKSIFEYMKSNVRHFDSYISFHGFSQQLMFPSGRMDFHDSYENLHRDDNIVIYKALKKRYNTRYEIGSINDFYQLSGSSVDYVYHVFRKPIVFLYKLRDKGRYGFLLPPEQIIPTGEEN
ncbi:zinc carboxypeptidase-like isoform X2 [Temnothorax nylanderi]|uniref:zinc carboxypeptidase-like isoform X2 n=1 Tax=Temnothorax nylanderi TaxID=102681 RepID=UPI003A8B6505